MAEIKDWKGNEVKAGMTIYFVKTRATNFGRVGLIMPDGNYVWESDEDYEERKNEEVWELGDEMIVHENEKGRLYVKPETKGAGELEGYTFSTIQFLDKPFPFAETFPIIAIKGISDKQ